MARIRSWNRIEINITAKLLDYFLRNNQTKSNSVSVELLRTLHKPE